MLILLHLFILFRSEATHVGVSLAIHASENVLTSLAQSNVQITRLQDCEQIQALGGTSAKIRDNEMAETVDCLSFVIDGIWTPDSGERTVEDILKKWKEVSLAYWEPNLFGSIPPFLATVGEPVSQVITSRDALLDSLSLGNLPPSWEQIGKSLQFYIQRRPFFIQYFNGSILQLEPERICVLSDMFPNERKLKGLILEVGNEFIEIEGFLSSYLQPLSDLHLPPATINITIDFLENLNVPAGLTLWDDNMIIKNVKKNNSLFMLDNCYSMSLLSLADLKDLDSPTWVSLGLLHGVAHWMTPIPYYEINSIPLASSRHIMGGIPVTPPERPSKFPVNPIRLLGADFVYSFDNGLFATKDSVYPLHSRLPSSFFAPCYTSSQAPRLIRPYYLYHHWQKGDPFVKTTLSFKLSGQKQSEVLPTLLLDWGALGTFIPETNWPLVTPLGRTANFNSIPYHTHRGTIFIPILNLNLTSDIILLGRHPASTSEKPTYVIGWDILRQLTNYIIPDHSGRYVTLYLCPSTLLPPSSSPSHPPTSPSASPATTPASAKDDL